MNSLIRNLGRKGERETSTSSINDIKKKKKKTESFSSTVPSYVFGFLVNGSIKTKSFGLW